MPVPLAGLIAILVEELGSRREEALGVVARGFEHGSVDRTELAALRDRVSN
jgi:hypothetical protein